MRLLASGTAQQLFTISLQEQDVSRRVLLAAGARGGYGSTLYEEICRVFPVGYEVRQDR